MAGELQAATVPLVARILGAHIIGTRDWLHRPAAAECGSSWETACRIYAELTGLTLPEAMPPRERRRVDAVLDVDGRRRIVEVAETQHFNRFRMLTPPLPTRRSRRLPDRHLDCAVGKEGAP
jgi:hypothetical protein